MSNPRFAPMTSALLVRKGDAVPSAVVARPLWQREAPALGPALTKPTFAFGTRPAAGAEAQAPAVALAEAPEPVAVQPEPLVAAPPPLVSEPARTPEARKPVALETPKPHRLMVTLSPEEYERLGIVAVKKGVTRHQLVRHGFELHMKKLMREFSGCGCIAGGPGRCGEGCAH